MNLNEIIKILIDALKQASYSYTIDDDACGSRCCSEEIELIDVKLLIQILEKELD